ncbi:MAG TPA: RluA family pseudouridine synthase [Aggregatilinea sp.]|uniref:RluA family pseudouridine synthase n=1 Tax=Aggregatilinea sp. TaxID=2806333 RepID=UPI002B53CDAE|nr:RluA family pseudouridine synthase [Aggregatilinea sp.]HML21235.1 RluA family pseudouridine synthase [Aggregatilinea sp.]
MSDSFEPVEFVAEASGDRLDKMLAAHFEVLSRSQIQALIRDGQVMVNGKPGKASYRVEGGETVVVNVPVVEEASAPAPEAIPLTVLYEDECVAVIDKPAGMVVHPAVGHSGGTLVNAVLARWPEIAAFSEPDRAGIVHRLDKETSGVIVIAKTPDALETMRDQFKARTVSKRYIALVEGVPETSEGIIDAPIGRDSAQRKRMAVVRDGRESVTEFRVLELLGDYALIEAFPKTGRTHQIRVHMAFVDHPVVGDTVYGRRKQTIKMKRHFLHAASITFRQPDTDETVTVESPLPAALEAVLNKLRA